MHRMGSGVKPHLNPNRLLHRPRIGRPSTQRVDQKLHGKRKRDHIELRANHDRRFTGLSEAITELGEQPAGHVVRIVVVVTTSAPEERCGDAGFETEDAIVPTVGAGGQHDGKAIADGQERRGAGAELDFVEGVGGDFGIRTESETGRTRATEEDIAADAEVEDGLVPKLVVDGAPGGADGDAGGSLRCGEGQGGDEGRGKGEGKREGLSRSAHGFMHRSAVETGQCSG